MLSPDGWWLNVGLSRVADQELEWSLDAADVYTFNLCIYTYSISYGIIKTDLMLLLYIIIYFGLGECASSWLNHQAQWVVNVIKQFIHLISYSMLWERLKLKVQLG